MKSYLTIQLDLHYWLYRHNIIRLHYKEEKLIFYSLSENLFSHKIFSEGDVARSWVTQLNLSWHLCILYDKIYCCKHHDGYYGRLLFRSQWIDFWFTIMSNSEEKNKIENLVSTWEHFLESVKILIETNY